MADVRSRFPPPPLFFLRFYSNVKKVRIKTFSWSSDVPLCQVSHQIWHLLLFSCFVYFVYFQIERKGKSQVCGMFLHTLIFLSDSRSFEHCSPPFTHLNTISPVSPPFPRPLLPPCSLCSCFTTGSKTRTNKSELLATAKLCPWIRLQLLWTSLFPSLHSPFQISLIKMSNFYQFTHTPSCSFPSSFELSWTISHFIPFLRSSFFS